jgi:DNA repair protein RadC
VVLANGGDSFAVALNHPGGMVEPSDADREATAAIRQAAEACGLRFLTQMGAPGGIGGA